MRGNRGPKRGVVEDILDIATRAKEAQAEAAKWKDEYSNLCKFANDYEASAAAMRKELAAIYNRLPISGLSEPIIASGLCYDIREMAFRGLSGEAGARLLAERGRYKILLLIAADLLGQVPGYSFVLGEEAKEIAARIREALDKGGEDKG